MDQSAQLPYAPGDRCHRWLLIGIIALIIDLLLGIAVTVLKFQHWGEDGVTPDIVVTGVAIIPQLFVVAAYLVLARESNARGLWKSTAGMTGSYLLACLFGLILLGILPDSGNTAVMIAVGLGLLALITFSLSGVPRFSMPSAPRANAEGPAADSESSDRPGWLGSFAIFVVFLVLRVLFRRFVRPAFRGGLDIDDWQLIELFVVFMFGLSFAIWFAVTKIRHRRALGRMASLTGWGELLILLIHVGMAVTIFTVLINEAAANPMLDDNGVDQLLDPWIRRASLISAVSHGIWVILTATFFAVIRSQTQRGVEPGHDEAEK